MRCLAGLGFGSQVIPIINISYRCLTLAVDASNAQTPMARLECRQQTYSQ